MDNVKDVSNEHAEGIQDAFRDFWINFIIVQICACTASPKAFAIIDIMTAQTKRLSFSLARRIITPASS